MRKLKLFSLLCLLLVGVGQVWATDATLTITRDDVTTANNYGTDSEWEVGTVSGYCQIYGQTRTSLQFNGGKPNGTEGTSSGQVIKSRRCWNTVAIPGRIKSVTITTASGTERAWCVFCGTSAATSSSGVTYGTEFGSSATATTSGTTWNVPNNDNTNYTYFMAYSNTTNASYISSIVITYETSGGTSNPTLSLTPDSWDFETIGTSDAASKTFTLSGSNLTAGALTISVPSGYSVSPNSLNVSAGTLEDTEFTVSKNTTTAGTYNGNFTIYGGGVAEADAATATLQMEVVAPVAVTGVTLNKNATSLEIGGTETLEATIAPDNATNKNVTWESSNTSIATVDENGVVTAVAAGNATITCKSAADETKYAECAVTVVAPLPKSSLIFTAAYGNGPGTADDGVKWTVSSDGTESSFDSQNGKGIHYGTSSAEVQYIKLNTTEISGIIKKVVVNASTASGVSATVSVKVGDAAFGGEAQSLTSSAAEYTFTGSASGEIEVLVTKPSSATKAIYCKSVVVTYEATPTHEFTYAIKSGDESKGSVEASVTSGSQVAEGATVTLTPSANQYYKVKAVTVLDGNADEVTVTENDGVYSFAMPTSDAEAEVSFEYIPVTSVSVASTLELVEGETHTLSATVLPTNALGTVEWESDDTDVATVDANGKVTAKAEGTATITATSVVSGSVSGTCAVTVSAPTGNPVTISQTTGGTVAANVEVADVLEGVSVTLTATPDAGYSVSGWTIEGVDAGDLTISEDKTTCTFEMPNSEVLAEASFTHEEATLKLVELNVENAFDSENTHYWKESVTLPSLAGLGCSGKVFRGWSDDADCTTEPTLKAGDSYVLPNKGENKLYAVFATEVDGTPDTWTIDNTNFSTVGSGSGYAPYNGDHTESGITYNTNQVMLQSSKVQFQKNAGVMYNKTAFDADIVSIAINGVDANISVYAGAEALSSTPGSGAISLSSGVYPVTSGKRYFRIVMGNATGAATSITVNLKGESSYSGYTTECEAQLPVLAAPTFPVAEGVFYESTDITISAADGASIYYTTDGTTPSSTNGTLYEGAITLNAYGTYNFKAIAIQAGHEDSEVAEATYYFGMTFASVSDLYSYLEANSLTSLNNVKVTGLVSRITTAWNGEKGYLTYYISDNGQTTNDLQMYRGAGEGASALAVGDQVTVIGNYTLFQSTTHEFGAGNTIVARTAAAVASVAIGGAAEKTTYSPEDNQFSRTGLTATATYNTGYTKDVTALATWTNNLTNNIVAASGNVEVTATYEGKSDMKEVAVVYATKTLDHIVLSYTSKTAYIGQDLPTPTVTAYYVEDIDPENVTELVAAAESPYGFDTEGAYDGNTAGTYTINVSYHLGEVTKSATYTVTVKSIYNDESDPYSVADALDLIGANFNTTTASADSIVVAGIVSRLDGTYVNTYWISDDGKTNNELEVYSGKYLNKVAFTAANQLHVGDVVVVKGKVKTYQSTKEFDSNSRLISVLREPEFAIADIVAGDEFEANFSEDLEVVPTANSGDVEFTLTSGNEAVVTIVNGKLHAVEEGDAVITASRAATNNANALNYKAKEITFNVHVIAERTRYTVTFDANGGEGTDPAAIANQLAGATVDMPAACLYNKEGHAFTGWTVINLSTEAEIEVENDQFVMPAANVKIQAQWEEVATCAISFQIGGHEVATANAPQEADYNISQVGAPVPGFTFLGWSETAQAGELETCPTLINVYHAQAGEDSKILYGIYSRVEGAGETNHYVLDYTEDGIGDLITASYGNAVNVTAKDGSQWVVKAYKNSGMQINTGKNASIKIPNCPGNIVSIGITCSAAKAVGLSAADYSGSGTITYVVSGSDATSQTLDFAGKTVTAGYIVAKTGSTSITHIDVAYSAEVTYYTSSPVEKVTVTFALAGGEGGCQTTKINKGSELTICDAVPTKLHSEFTGWKNGDDVYVAGTAYTFDADITLTAQWNEAAKYTVTYAAGGATGSVPTDENSPYFAGDQVTVLGQGGLEKSGYEFQGWLNGNKLYAAAATFAMPAENVTLTAQWRKENVAEVASEKMTLITDASGLINGMEVALGCSYGENNFAMAGEISSDVMASVTEGVSLSDGIATFTSSVVMMIAEQVEGGWKLRKDETNYLKENTAKKVAWATSEDATVWTISFNNGNAIIANGNNKLQFNSGSPRFTTYSSAQTAIQLFGKAIVVTDDVNISDLGYVGEDQPIVASGQNVTLTIDEPTTTPSITATNGATVVIDAPTTAQSVNVEEGSKIEVNEPTTTPIVTFATTLGSTDAPSTGSALGTANNITLAAGGEIHYDITLGTSLEGVQADPNQWHAFTVPFPVDVLNGIYNAETGAKLTNEMDYAIMDYHGDIRANGQYGWKKFRGTLVPGTFYIMTVNGDVKTFRFKMSVAAATVLQALNSMAYTAFGGTDAENPNYGWNGIGNPSWVSVTLGYNVQVLDPYSYEYQTLTAGTVISASTPFFYKANANSTMTMTESDANAQYAPARTPANEIKNLAVRFGNEVFADKLYVTASEDALNSYEQDKDLVKMTMSKTPKVAQIFGEAYGMKLSMVNTPMVNNQAEVALTLYAPAAGEYTIAAPALEGYQIYLLQDGAIIWNLSLGSYTADLAKGNNTGYSIRIAKAPQVETGVGNVDANEAGVQKVIIDEHVFILRGEKLFDVTGKAVK